MSLLRQDSWSERTTMAHDERSFTEFKKDFYGKFPDLSVFECGDVNLLKVVLDGLKVNYAERFPARTPVFSSLLFHRAFLFLKRKRLRGTGEAVKELRAAGGKNAWCVDFEGKSSPGENGQLVSFYFSRLMRILGSSAALLNGSSRKTYSGGIAFGDVLAEGMVESLSADDKVFRDHLRRTFTRIRETGKLNATELLSVKNAFQRFFDSARGWNRIFQTAKPECVFFVMHYHREGFVYAMKKNGVRSVELQHGLIAKEDIFYVFPPQVRSIRDRALFADRIFVYGEYWKEVLAEGAEYGEEHVRVLGYYADEGAPADTKLPDAVLKFIDGKKTALVCTQTFMHDEYDLLVRRLSALALEKGWNCVFLVKPHPHEQLADYAPLDNLPNVKTVQVPLPLLMQSADVHFSVYSTTHFDAARFGVKSIALPSEKYGDYVRGITASGVAELYDFESDPFSGGEKSRMSEKQKTFFYAPFDVSSFPAERLIAMTK
ncbi:MAG TPA: hypothetical protein VFU15_07925 [Bacteroidia bacterium]|nr:hypothetical protein [Bacteroidia bacterium]